ncbi:MAG: MoxR family ATPase [Zavarzinella sp.]
MRPTELVRAVSALLSTSRPVYLWGPPGIGKSTLIRQVALAGSLPLVDIRATLLDPVDLRGLPHLNNGSVQWCPPAFLPSGGEGILFLDELAQAPPLVQSACLQLTLDRRLGEYELPAGWSIIAASNRSEDRAGTHRLISPLLNRFIHLDLEPSLEDWQTWAIGAGIAPEVRSFLNFRPNLLYGFDPGQNSRAFPTPRSWEFVSNAISKLPEELLHPVVVGCIGEGPAAEFTSFLRLSRQIPNIDDALQHPDTTVIPHDPATLYALVGALVERCRQDQAPLPQFVRYACRLPEEFGMVAIRDALNIQPKLAALPAVQDWIRNAREQGLFLRP